MPVSSGYLVWTRVDSGEVDAASGTVFCRKLN